MKTEIKLELDGTFTGTAYEQDTLIAIVTGKRSRRLTEEALLQKVLYRSPTKFEFSHNYDQGELSDRNYEKSIASFIY